MLGGLFGSYNVAPAGNIAQIWSPYLYSQSDGPAYTRAFATNSAMTAVSILFCTLLRLCLKRNNAQLDREEAEASIVKDVGEDETTDGFSESLATPL
ncbi:hypothetical protein DMC30DRAFT_413189 [Rhodotorula diobovata]|uniref:Uncharacterized protein n=1 Tax=Rhodotorula diobovata TaxID=5288 RepID=A0A5C5G876_9BASI|nr:hypothetical protein DMC30DRAFT_413189 [Rhodotorula diobovata]